MRETLFIIVNVMVKGQCLCYLILMHNHFHLGFTQLFGKKTCGLVLVTKFSATDDENSVCIIKSERVLGQKDA